jgi:hypothetical protein
MSSARHAPEASVRSRTALLRPPSLRAASIRLGLGSIAVVAIVSASATGCSSSNGSPGGGAPSAPFGPPPSDIGDPPPNSATASTNTSTFWVYPQDSPSCANATSALFEWVGAVNGPGTYPHFVSNDFDEALNETYTTYAYLVPVNLLVDDVAGSTALYRCAETSNNNVHFASTDPKCEGQYSDDLTLGYVYTYTSGAAPPSNTTLLYRYKYKINSSVWDYQVAFQPPGSGWSQDATLGYVPNLACKNLSATCQPYPSYYLGYVVNPSGAYGDNAPAPPWFGNYTAAGSNGNAILPGDNGTANNVDWDSGQNKAECGYTDWMTGLSNDPAHSNASHAFRCAMSSWALSSRTFGSSIAGSVNCILTASDNLGDYANGNDDKYFSNNDADWDPGYGKASCGAGYYMAGVSANPGKNDAFQGALCCEQAGITASDCSTVVLGQPSSEMNTSTTVDSNGNVVPLNWDPPSGSTSFLLGECGAGRRMMGVGTYSNGGVHSILCCSSQEPTTAQASTSCCAPVTLQKALANCNADNATYEADCDNIVAPCCDSDPNSDGVGGANCAADAEATDPNASNPEGPGGANTAGSTANAGAACGSSGQALAWSYSYNQSGSVGNHTFGGGYAGDTTFGAGPIYANGDANVSATASLFGYTITIADVNLEGSLSSQPLSATITVLGKDLYSYTTGGAKQSNDAGAPPASTPYDAGSQWTWDAAPAEGGSTSSTFDSDNLTYTETFFSEQEVIFLFGVPINIGGTIAGQVGLTVSSTSAGDTLTFDATPWVGATATCSASLGGGKGAFSLTAGVQGSLNLFTASLPTTATITPFTNQVNYTLESDFTLAALSGNIQAYLKVKLKPFFNKTFRSTLANWNGVTSTTHLYHLNGCASY